MNCGTPVAGETDIRTPGVPLNFFAPRHRLPLKPFDLLPRRARQVCAVTRVGLALHIDHGGGWRPMASPGEIQFVVISRSRS